MTEARGDVDLTIIIINWNTRDELRDSLASIRARPHRHTVEVVVSDNASSDGSRAMLAEEFADVRLIVSPSNAGFGAGNNRAIPAARGRFVMFLNSDTIVTPGALDSLVEFADAHPDIGIVGPRLLNRDGSLQYSCRHFPNLGTGFFRNTPLGRLFPRNRFNQDYLLTDWDHATERDVDWVSGAALMIRREALDRLGGFDEGFFMYCEDVDLCYRAHEAGWRVVYQPNAVIYHIIGRSTDKVPTRMTYHFHKSMYRFYQKHYRERTPILVRPLIVPGLVARATGQIVRYRWRHLRRRLRGA
ncbi:MAG: glycosyltransferase family 2 protein [Chthonomonadales bacterium]|nr:glycosyltransferase family 2 protein [Chthonomonadales bacterium]